MSLLPPLKTSRNKVRWLHEQLPEWEQRGVISAETAMRLRALYADPAPASERSTAQVLLGCLGALLIATGVILLLAHNWVDLARSTRALISIGCLITGQLAVGWTHFRRLPSQAWREGSAALLGMGVAACIALIGQTYQIPGDLESFLLVWALLTVPLPYLLRSGFAFLLLQVLLLTWTFHAGPSPQTLLVFSAIQAASLPYLSIAAGTRQSLMLKWMLTTCLSGSLGAVVPLSFPGSGILLYGFFFAVLVQVCPSEATWSRRWWRHPLAILGEIGVVGLALILTFPDVWSGLINTYSAVSEGFWDVAVVALLAGGTAVLTKGNWRPEALFVIRASAGWAIALGVLFASRGEPWTAALCMNLLVLGLASAQMRRGYMDGRLGQFNVGFLQLSILLLLRFFDSELGLLPRAGIFIVLGVAFLAINSLLSRRLRTGPRGSADSTEDVIGYFGTFREHWHRRLRDSILQLIASRRVLFTLLFITFAFQFSIPAKMMLDREMALRSGGIFRFETAPVDPYDPFRGRYVALGFPSASTVATKVDGGDPLEGKAFAVLETDKRGFARVKSLHRTRPEVSNYLQVDVYRRYDGVYRVTFPFDRYYMNEAVAPEAERLYLLAAGRRDSEGESTVDSHAVIHVRHGIGVISGLYLNGQPIEEAVAGASSSDGSPAGSSLSSNATSDGSPEEVEASPRSAPSTQR